MLSKHSENTQDVEIPINAYARGRRPWGVMRAVTYKRVLPKVEGEAFPGAELIDLTKI